MLLAAAALAAFGHMAQGQAPAQRGAQEPGPLPGEVGAPFVQHYRARQYRAETQNWAVAQDLRGVLFFGNTDGILEFDGSRWRLLQLPNKALVRSLAIDNSGRLFAGGKNELGYVVADSAGRMRFVSLLPELPEAQRAFGRVTGLRARPEGVFFLTDKYLFQWVNGQMRTWQSEAGFTALAEMADTLYVVDAARGLLREGPAGLAPVPGGAAWRGLRVVGVLPLATPGAWLLATREQGLLRWQNGTLTEWAPAARATLVARRPAACAKTADGTYAIGTLTGGLLEFDEAGHLVSWLTKEGGLMDETVLALGQDAEGALWAALNNGISRVESRRRLEAYTDRQRLAGTVTGVARLEGRLYAATSQGLARLRPAQMEAALAQNSPALALAAFEPVPGTQTDCWSLAGTASELLVGTGQGVLVVAGGQVRTRIPLPGTAYSVHVVRRAPGWAVVGTPAGVHLLRKRAGLWALEGVLRQAMGEVRSVHEAADGRLWMGTLAHGVLCADFSAGPRLDAPVQAYGIAEGLPSLSQNNTFALGGQLAVGSQAGVLRLADGPSGTGRLEKHFAPDARFDSLLGKPRPWVLHLAETAPGRLLLHLYPERRTLGAVLDSGRFVPARVPLLRLQDFDVATLGRDSATARLWLGGSDGLVSYSPLLPTPPAINFATLIRQVRTARGQPIFSGTFTTPKGSLTLFQHEYMQPRLRYAQRSLRFEVAATSYDNAEANQYQYFLENFDDEWSPWTPEAVKVYTNLPYGAFRLHVRSRNTYGQLGEPAVYAFSIARPWYFTYWAYTAYLALVVVGMWVAVRWYGHSLEDDKRRLEGVVNERTAEIAHRRQQLEHAYIEIADQNERIKTAFEEVALANTQLTDTMEELRATQHQLILAEKASAVGHLVDGIAHEMNTPLGAIKASVVNLQNAIPELIHSYPKWLGDLSPEKRAGFHNLLQWALEERTELSTKEERQKRREVQARLDAERLPQSADTARKLVELGLASHVERLLPQLHEPEAPQLIDYLHKIGRMDISLETIGLAALKTEKIVFTLKSYGKMHRAEEPVAVQVPRTLEEILPLYASHFRTNVALVKDFAPVPDVMGSPDELSQVWTNLIINALQAMKYSGRLGLRVFAENGAVITQVQDDGPGIAPELGQRIFEPFFTTRPPGEGTGLGLDICAKIVQRLGGSLTYRSRPGETVFTVLLHAAQD